MIEAFIQLILITDGPKFIRDYQSIIAAVLSVSIVMFGWHRNHKLTLRAQERQLLNQIANTARLEISSKLREYQLFLTAIYKYVDSLKLKILREGDSNINWDDEKKAYDKMVEKPEIKWLLLCQEYHSLFPELAPIIKKLDELNKQIYQWALWFHLAFFKQAHDEHSRIQILNTALAQKGRVHDQVCVVEDLLIYLQNKVLSRLTGSKVPYEEYTDNPSRPKIRVEKGTLQFIEGKNIYPANVQFKTPNVGPETLLNIEGRL